MMTRSLVMILPLLLTQCATLTSGTSQSVLVDILNAQGATCRGTDNEQNERTCHLLFLKVMTRLVFPFLCLNPSRPLTSALST